MNQHVDLIANCWTIGGDVIPGGDRSQSCYSLRERIEATSAAGYSGIGLWYGDLMHTRKNNGYRELRHMLESNGMHHIELEYLADWFSDGAQRQRSNDIKEELFQAADELGARHIKIVPPFGDQNVAPDRLVEQFAVLCAEAAAHELLVALEMIPFSDLPTLDETVAVIAGAAAANGGLLIDIWHVMRAGVDFDTLRRLPAHYIVAAELNDADLTLRGSMAEDSMRYRKFCGDGAFDVPGFIGAMTQAGYRGPYGVEILSDELRTMPLTEVANRSFKTTRARFQPRTE